MQLLTFRECCEVVEAALAAGLGEPGRRARLFDSPSLMASLPSLDRPRDQFIADVDELVRSSYSAPEHPLLGWLERAAELTRPRAEAAVFEQYRALADRRIGGPWGQRADPTWGPPAGRLHAIRLVAPIADHLPQITEGEVRDACRPAEVREDDIGLLIDLCSGRPAPVQDLAKQVEADVSGFIRYRARTCKGLKLAIFGFAPIPLLIVLGRAIGDKQTAHVFERHRHTDDWRWGTQIPPLAELSMAPRLLDRPSGEAAIVVSISDRVKMPAVEATVEGPFDVFEIRAEQPRVNLIRAPEQLHRFSALWRQALDAAHGRVGHTGRVHVFAATPLSVSVEMGRRMLPNADPPLLVYDYRCGAFEHALRLHG